MDWLPVARMTYIHTLSIWFGWCHGISPVGNPRFYGQKHNILFVNFHKLFFFLDNHRANDHTLSLVWKFVLSTKRFVAASLSKLMIKWSVNVKQLCHSIHTNSHMHRHSTFTYSIRCRLQFLCNMCHTFYVLLTIQCHWATLSLLQTEIYSWILFIATKRK